MSVKIATNQKEWSKMYGTTNRPVKNLRDFIDHPGILNNKIGLLSGVVQDARGKRVSPALDSLLKVSVHETPFNSCGCNPDLPYIELWLSKTQEKKGLFSKFFGNKNNEIEATVMSDELKPSVPDENAIEKASEVFSLLTEKDFEGTNLCLSVGQMFLHDGVKDKILDFGFYFNKKPPELRDYPNPLSHARAMTEYGAESERFFKLVEDILTRPARQEVENIQPSALGQKLAQMISSLPNYDTTLDYVNLYFTNTNESTIVARANNNAKLNFDGFTIDELAEFPTLLRDIQPIYRRHIHSLIQAQQPLKELS